MPLLLVSLYKDYSNVRIIGLDSNWGYQIDEQLDWLDGILNLACDDDNIDFVFAELHHPHKSELWLAGETDYTGEVISRMEAFHPCEGGKGRGG